jgi:hypothetical protein
MLDEYKGNLLIEPLGPIPTAEELKAALIKVPRWKRPPAGAEPHLLPHCLSVLRRVHIPSETSFRVASALQVMIRQCYVARNPVQTEAWRRIYGIHRNPRLKGASVAMFLGGCSGSGKTEALIHALDLFPPSIEHAVFPQMASGLIQIPYLLVRVPPSGSAVDLGAALNSALDEALGLPAGSTKMPKTAYERLKLFEQRARIHFLGLLALDEIGHLFRVASIKERRRAQVRGAPMLLRVNDDEAVKWVVYVAETADFPIILSGTADGMSLLSSRLAAAQRLTTAGCHIIPLPSRDDGHAKMVLECLLRYQVLPKELKMSDELLDTVFEYSAHIPRIRAALLHQSQTRAIERGAAGLSIEDLHWTARHGLAALMPAVEALRSGKPDALSRYEDVLPRDDAFWSQLFS